MLMMMMGKAGVLWRLESEFGAHEHGLSFIAIEFEIMFGHRILDIVPAGDKGGWREWIIGIGGKWMP